VRAHHPDRGTELGHGLGQADGGEVLPGWQRRHPEARQVDGDHLAVRGEVLDHRRPHLLATADAVQQHQRLAGADTRVGKFGHR